MTDEESQAMLKAIYVDLDIMPVDFATHSRNMQKAQFDLGGAVKVGVHAH